MLRERVFVGRSINTCVCVCVCREVVGKLPFVSSANTFPIGFNGTWLMEVLLYLQAREKCKVAFYKRDIY